MEKYIEKLESVFPQMVEFTRELMAIPSVKADGVEGAPFGTEIRRALDITLAKADELGFKDQFNADGYAAHAQSEGEGEPIGILAHLDVVPEGTGWIYPPYSATIADGKLYGRGALDDKGPLAAALFAAYAVGETVGFNRPVRFIFGCDEESGWADIDYYNTVAKMPEVGFSPDSTFPVVNAEKGICHFTLNNRFFEYTPGHFKLLSLGGGDRVNVVPDTARAELIAVGDPSVMKKAVLEFATERDVSLSVLEAGRELTLIARGKPAHGSRPSDGVNAVAILLDFLTIVDLGSGDPVAYIKEMQRLFSGKTSGEEFCLQISDEQSGALTMNLGNLYLNMEDNSARAEVDIRYPVTYDDGFITSTFDASIRTLGAELTVSMVHKPLYVAKDHPLVSTLLEVYNTETGKNAVPLALGGGTYARALKTGVAFGPVDEGMEANEHEANEYIRLEDLYKCARLYAHAIYKLTR